MIVKNVLTVALLHVVMRVLMTVVSVEPCHVLTTVLTVQRVRLLMTRHVLKLLLTAVTAQHHNVTSTVKRRAAKNLPPHVLRLVVLKTHRIALILTVLAAQRVLKVQNVLRVTLPRVMQLLVVNNHVVLLMMAQNALLVQVVQRVMNVALLTSHNVVLSFNQKSHVVPHKNGHVANTARLSSLI
jgi:hypothetical protein